MDTIFKINLEDVLHNKKRIEIELGSGGKKKEGRICIDHLGLENVDIVADLEKGLPFLPDNSVDAIYSKSFLEHIDNLDILLKDIWRVLKPDGKKYLFVPHFSNPYFYSDYTHKRFFGLYSFEYFSKSDYGFKRKVPHFYNDHNFITEEITLVFKSPWKSRKLLKRAFGTIVNLNKWTQEFYEENFCFIVPCYGMQVILRPDKKQK